MTDQATIATQDPAHTVEPVVVRLSDSVTLIHGDCLECGPFKMKKKKAMKIRYQIEIEQDDIPVRGNAIASGDNATDKAVEIRLALKLARRVSVKAQKQATA